MITVKPIDGRYEHGYVIDGHANSAEHGQDIVCASVSSITQTAYLGIRHYGKANLTQRSGYFEVEIIESNKEVKAIIKTMIYGLVALKLEYPQYVNVMEESE